MAIQTRNITVTLSDFDGSPLEGARVIIKLVGLGNEPAGAVSPGTKEALTNASGIATFTLWENRIDYSDTYYEISSFHPSTGQGIHQREQFLVFDSDADVKDLIGLDLSGIDPTQALLNQIAQDKISAANSATAALGYKDSAQSSATTATSAAGTATAQAGISTAQAGTATTQAGITTTQAGIATSAATTATNGANTATTQAGTATTQAEIATSQAVIATSGASTATTKAGEAGGHAAAAGYAAGVSTTQAGISTAQAVIATTQAGIATTKASEAVSAAAQTTDDLTATTAAKNLAEKWAIESEDVPVTSGLYSAFHWAKKAQGFADVAAGGGITSVNGKTGSAITLNAAEVGAATAAQGDKADTAVQPAALNDYATKIELNKVRKLALAAI
jgi:hypothetical protein